MKNVLKVLAVSVFFTVIMLSVTALADNNAEGIVTADVLNIRSQPNTDSVILGQFPNGSIVTVTEAKDNWYKITYGQNIAFLCADYVALNTLPNYVEEFTYTTPVSNTDNLIYTDIPSYVGSQTKGEILVENAKAYIGTPYVYGGMSPRRQRFLTPNAFICGETARQILSSVAVCPRWRKALLRNGLLQIRRKVVYSPTSASQKCRYSLSFTHFNSCRLRRSFSAFVSS